MYKLLPLLLLLSLASCRSYSYLNEFSISPDPPLLPKLKTITDQEIFTDQSTENGETYTRSINTYSNIRYVQRQFNQYVLDQLTDTKTDQTGYAVLRINHLQVYNKYSLLSILSILSVGTINLAGIPAGKYEVEVDLTMEVLDNKQKMLATYNGKGSASAWIAMYYGYGEKEAKEKGLYESIEMALNAVNEKVIKDFDYLKKELQKKSE